MISLNLTLTKDICDKFAFSRIYRTAIHTALKGYIYS